MAMKDFTIVFVALLLLASPFLQVARCQSESEAEVVEGGDIGLVGEDVLDFGDGSFSPAGGVDTVCVFPKNNAKLVTAGEETELLVGMKNDEIKTPKSVQGMKVKHTTFRIKICDFKFCRNRTAAKIDSAHNLSNIGLVG